MPISNSSPSGSSILVPNSATASPNQNPSGSPQSSPPPSQPPQQKRTRSERVAVRATSQGMGTRFSLWLKRDYFGIFLLMMFAASVAIAAVIQAWDPPLRFRLNSSVPRAIVCNTEFSISSPEAKRRAIEQARWEALHIYVNDPAPLVQLRESLWNTVAGLVNVNSYDQLDANSKDIWNNFLRPGGKESIPEDVVPKAAFETFISYFKDDTSFELFNNRLKKAFIPFELHGTLASLNYGPEQGSQDQILIYPKGETPENAVPFKVNEVLLRDGARFKEAFQREWNNTTLADQLYNWLNSKLMETLKEDKNATADLERKAAKAIKDVKIEYVQGQVLIEAGETLDAEDMTLLQTEYKAAMSRRYFHDRVLRFTAVSGILMTLFVISWGFIHRLERRRPKSPHMFMVLMTSMVLTIVAARSGTAALQAYVQGFSLINAEWEIAPLVLFVMVIAITYSWELSIILSCILSMIIVFGNGGGTYLLTILVGVVISTSIQLGRLRSRKKLVVVSFISGLVAFILTITAGLLTDRVIGPPLFIDAFFNFLWSLFAGFVMTGLLPFIEEPFGILTDMSLLELGDVSHPLLQSLVRLAPATYGHSMQVGTIAETAADAIGARGLLTRVGAYFHDIGKMMKPEYYSENQGGMDNIHDHIEPQVSTIVLIAHVKDGIDLARQHRLPQPLIDLIEQHHGTSLVSFFYGRAAKSNKDESGKQVEESTFRYPGPKPQSKEAAILMIADTCESACRSMGSAATPGKIENKVHLLIKQKLDDGQFDDCGLTLKELKTIKNSVIKSIIAAMHGRIKYPGQEAEEAAKPAADPEHDSVIFVQTET